MAMKELEFSIRTRRTSRVAVRIPLQVTVRNSSGKLEELTAWTIVVNEHGARCECSRSFEENQAVDIVNPANKEQAIGRVVWCGGTPDAAGKYEFAVELDQPSNLWHINFPPPDWKYTRDSKYARSGMTEPSQAIPSPAAPAASPAPKLASIQSAGFATVPATTPAPKAASVESAPVATAPAAPSAPKVASIETAGPATMASPVPKAPRIESASAAAAPAAPPAPKLESIESVRDHKPLEPAAADGSYASETAIPSFPPNAVEQSSSFEEETGLAASPAPQRDEEEIPMAAFAADPSPCPEAPPAQQAPETSYPAVPSPGANVPASAPSVSGAASEAPKVGMDRLTDALTELIGSTLRTKMDAEAERAVAGMDQRLAAAQQKIAETHAAQLLLQSRKLANQALIRISEAADQSNQRLNEVSEEIVSTASQSLTGRIVIQMQPLEEELLGRCKSETEQLSAAAIERARQALSQQLDEISEQRKLSLQEISEEIVSAASQSLKDRIGLQIQPLEKEILERCKSEADQVSAAAIHVLSEHLDQVSDQKSRRLHEVSEEIVAAASQSLGERITLQMRPLEERLLERCKSETDQLSAAAVERARHVLSQQLDEISEKLAMREKALNESLADLEGQATRALEDTVNRLEAQMSQFAKAVIGSYTRNLTKTVDEKQRDMLVRAEAKIGSALGTSMRQMRNGLASSLRELAEALTDPEQTAAEEREARKDLTKSPIEPKENNSNGTVSAGAELHQEPPEVFPAGSLVRNRSEITL